MFINILFSLLKVNFGAKENVTEHFEVWAFVPKLVTTILKCGSLLFWGIALTYLFNYLK
jgi:hypothetical protein